MPKEKVANNLTKEQLANIDNYAKDVCRWLEEK